MSFHIFFISLNIQNNNFLLLSLVNIRVKHTTPTLHTDDSDAALPAKIFKLSILMVKLSKVSFVSAFTALLITLTASGSTASHYLELRTFTPRNIQYIWYSSSCVTLTYIYISTFKPPGRTLSHPSKHLNFVNGRGHRDHGPNQIILYYS